ncbi:MAG: hypothetical protein O7G85_00005, partial [Planctomycetota bacterium]|nr:hypothetical protein [Planctomycetota bacterium]
ARMLDGLDVRLDFDPANSLFESPKPKVEFQGISDPFSMGVLRQDPANLGQDDDDKWHVVLQPYVWIPARIDVASTVSGGTADIKIDFSDVLDNAEELLAFSFRAEAWKGRWGIIFDGYYARVEFDPTFELFDGRRDLDVNIKIEQAIVDLALGWRAIDRPMKNGDSPWPHVVVDLFGGVRYQYLKQRINLSTGPRLGTSKDWMEIMVGGRVAISISEKIAFAIRADASGFGIGSGSDLTYNIVTGMDINFSPTFSMKVGYGYSDMDYSNGSGTEEFGFDGNIHGPYLGFSWAF